MRTRKASNHSPTGSQTHKYFGRGNQSLHGRVPGASQRSLRRGIFDPQPASGSRATTGIRRGAAFSSCSAKKGYDATISPTPSPAPRPPAPQPWPRRSLRRPRRSPRGRPTGFGTNRGAWARRRSRRSQAAARRRGRTSAASCGACLFAPLVVSRSMGLPSSGPPGSRRPALNSSISLRLYYSMPANSLPPSAPHRYAFAATRTPMILRKTMASPPTGSFRASLWLRKR